MKDKFRNTMKRMGAMALATTLAATTAITGGAATTIDKEATGSITIYKYADVSTDYASTGEENSAMSTYAESALAGVKFVYIKAAELDDSTSTLKYTLTSGVAAALDTAEGSYTSSELNAILTTADTDTLVSYANTYLASNEDSYLVTDSSGYAKASSLTVGLYLVVETEVPADVATTTAPFFVSIPMTNTTGDGWNYDVVVYPKNQSSEVDVSVDKAAEGSATVGKSISYTVVNQIPEITTSNTYLTKYVFTDTMGDSLSYNNDMTLSIYKDADLSELVEDLEADDFTVSKSGDANVYIIALTDAGLAKINPKYSEYYLVLSYTATVGTALLGENTDNGLTNSVTLTYARTNGEEKTTDPDDPDAIVTVYSYGLKITQEFSDEDGDPTKAGYILQDGEGNYIVATKDDDGEYTVTGVTSNKDEATTFYPDSDGSLVIEGLGEDTYTLTQTETDDGYVVSNPITIVIENTDGTTSATVDGESVDMESSDENKDNAYVTLTITNQKGFTLPQTGGMGTLLFTLGGALLLILGVLCMKKNRRNAA